MRLKHKLPICAETPHLDLDEKTLNDFIECIRDSEKEFKSVFEVNQDYLKLHNLDRDKYDVLKEISLTDCMLDETKSLDEIGDKIANSDLLAVYKLKSSIINDKNSSANEHTYTKKTAFYKKFEFLFDSIFSRIKGKPTRIRLVKLESGKALDPHIDYDPSYAVRIVIPIIADTDCVNLFWVKGLVQAVNLSAGKAYFLNTGFKHAVVNFSKNDRYTLMISILGQEDIEQLLSKD
jgi:hypothetical protein